MVNGYIDFRQSIQINEAQKDATSAKNTADSVKSQIWQLERRCDTLALASQAMWELLRESGGFTDDKIREKILEVDLRDGSQNGKVAPTPVICSSCNSRTSPNRDTCLYCGARLESEGTIFK